MAIYTPEFRELKSDPCMGGPYRKPAIPGEAPISMGSTRAEHHHTREQLAKRKVDQPARPRGGFSDAASERLAEIMRTDDRQWTARELAEIVFKDPLKSRLVASVLTRMRMRGEVESDGVSGNGKIVKWRLL